MADEQQPFADVRDEDGGFSIPELKWRELLFVGALREAPGDDGSYERDPSRPMPPFGAGEVFPQGARFLAERRGHRVVVRRI